MAVKKEQPQINGATTRLDVLCALRDRLSMEIDATSDKRSLGILAIQLRAVLREIESLIPYTVESPADEIAARVAKRRGWEAAG